ncbi:AMP-binding protein [Streptomyces shenzhenensis]|uniref:AMP-binding protein n=1 Tax=Streptomyces shenzhenensis TaxID=943815 RepID=UPI00340456E9
MSTDGLDLTGVCPLTTEAALHRAAVLAPDVEAVVGADGRITFDALAAEVASVRAALAAAGVRHGDHVAICLGNGGRWVSLFLAIGSLGAVTVPVNTRFRADEIAYTLRQSRAKLLFVADRFLKVDFVAMLREISPSIDTALPDPALPSLESVVVIGDEVPEAARSWKDFMAAADGPVDPDCSPDDVLLIQYTSGTTSSPKGVLLTHRSMCANAFFSGARTGLRPGDRFHSVRPFFHVAGTTLSILSCVQHTATLITMERFEPGEALRLMEAERCTHFSGNDTIALMLLGHPDLADRRLSLRGAWLAASPAVVRRVNDELGARECVTGYGLSETSPNVAQSAWWEPENVRVSARMQPQPGIRIRIRDTETGEDLPPGRSGEILVRGWSVMRGYYDQPEQTAQALSADGWLSTGDLGRLGDDGRLEFVGRAKELIRVGGENVSPAEVEDTLHRHPAIRQAAVVGVPDGRLLEVPFAFVTLKDGCTAEPADLLDWGRAHMAGFKAPRYLVVVEDFESIGMTASSKVQKKQLAARAAELLESESPQ